MQPAAGTLRRLLAGSAAALPAPEPSAPGEGPGPDWVDYVALVEYLCPGAAAARPATSGPAPEQRRPDTAPALPAAVGASGAADAGASVTFDDGGEGPGEERPGRRARPGSEAEAAAAALEEVRRRILQCGRPPRELARALLAAADAAAATGPGLGVGRLGGRLCPPGRVADELARFLTSATTPPPAPDLAAAAEISPGQAAPASGSEGPGPRGLTTRIPGADGPPGRAKPGGPASSVSALAAAAARVAAPAGGGGMVDVGALLAALRLPGALPATVRCAVPVFSPRPPDSESPRLSESGPPLQRHAASGRGGAVSDPPPPSAHPPPGRSSYRPHPRSSASPLNPRRSRPSPRRCRHVVFHHT